MTPPPKTYASCGRRIEWRKKWEQDWELLELLGAAGSRPVDVIEAAGAVSAATGEPRDELDEPARRAARRLASRGEVTIVQGGRVVGPSTAKGPISVRLTR